MLKLTNHFPPLLPGDLICVYGESWLSKAICFFERWLPNKWSRGKWKTSHIAVVYEPTILIEAVGRIRLSPRAIYNHTCVVIYRRKGIFDHQRDSYIDQLMSVWDSRYGWGKLILLLLDAVTHSYWFTQHCGITSFKVCSTFAAWGWDAIGWPISTEMDWKVFAPSVLDDYCAAHPEDWDVVYDSLA